MARKKPAAQSAPPPPAASASASPNAPPVPPSEAAGLLKMPPLEERDPPKSSFSDLLSLTDNDDVRFTFAAGCIFAFLNGLTTPALAHVISHGMTDLVAVSEYHLLERASGQQNEDDDGMAGVRNTALYFVGIGVYSFVCAFMQSMCMEVAAARTRRMFLTRWFGALLKQDAAFYDVYDPAVLAPTVLPNAAKIRKGLGRKLGEGVQFMTAFVGGLTYALISSWRVALVLLGAIPIVVVSVYAAFRFDRDRPKRAAEAYNARAAGVAQNAVLAIRTVLSRNAGAEMLRRYQQGTKDTYERSTRPLWRDGAVIGTALASFLLLFCVLTLYGSFLLHQDIRATGCDPSGVDGASTCASSGPAILGAIMGIAFAAQGISQMPPVFDAFQDARAGCYSAMVAIKRTEGAEAEEVVVALPKATKKSIRHLDTEDIEAGEIRVRAILPRYVIDSSSSGGLQPKGMSGALSFRAVSFAFPTKPHDAVLDDLNLSIKAGTTIALVGTAGSGKSTIVSLLQRFYDPTFGVIAIDGIDIRDINIHYLRSKVRHLGADPVVFETSIATNIRLGKLEATRQEIKKAAEMAGMHDFIMTLPEAYNSVIGDLGVQLTGGQMQRLALARALISQPNVLILDEATSALDRESGEDVQGIFNELASQRSRTTIIIPSHLSTICRVDSIVVVEQGKAVEIGNHEALMVAPTGYYRSLVEKENSGPKVDDSFFSKRRSSVYEDETKADEGRRGSLNDRHPLKFLNVSFAYPSRRKKMVLNRFNLSVRQGELLALVGPCGGGKMTALSLAERFYDPTAGTVEYKGQDLKKLDVAWLREQICFLQLNPPLLNTTIARNIDPSGDTPQERIKEACLMANVHSDIVSLPGGYNAIIVDGGKQLSTCLRQRIAIANAFLKNPRVILLDEATPFDDDLDEAVHVALERLVTSEGRTIVVAAHRNSTVRAADRIAFVVKGKVRDIGTHDELMEKPGGRYRQLVEESQKTVDFFDVETMRKKEVSLRIEDEDEEEEDAMEVEEEVEEEEFRAYDYQRARRMALPDAHILTLGSIGSIVVGGVFPMWGYLFGYVVNILFQRVSCEEVLCDYEDIADETRETSIRYGIYWIIMAAGCLIASTVTFLAFGLARERLNKRVRDSAFRALMRQELGYFDRRTSRHIAYLLEDDVARIHVFSGEPIRIIVTNLTSLVAGLTIACITMWPLALCSLAVFPLTLAATNLEVSTFLAEKDDSKGEGSDSPGGIVLETLLNIRTVSSLGIERQRYKDYRRALKRAEPNFVRMGLLSGVISGLPQIIQQLTHALKYWWGGWLLFYYGYKYTFKELAISLFSLFFALLSLGASTTGVSDHSVCERSAGSVFYLLNRESTIDTNPEDREE